MSYPPTPVVLIKMAFHPFPFITHCTPSLRHSGHWSRGLRGRAQNNGFWHGERWHVRPTPLGYPLGWTKQPGSLAQRQGTEESALHQRVEEAADRRKNRHLLENHHPPK
ncbi:hypothetical protein J6590_096188 [Homalodisca vitripennis]|nr:hypothetical protein J6590_096188 [Homalodisca vitripennis]